MASMFPGQVSAAQVGTFFLGQYYHVLQEKPQVSYQFYNDASSMMRIDGDTTESAASIMHIHSLLATLDFTGIEIKTAHFMNSWDGGVLVMVSGFVQTRGYSARRKFVQTFFLAPQEKGYFVLNDIFQFLDEDQELQHPMAALDHTNLESNLTHSNLILETAPDYIHGEEIQSREFESHVQSNENDAFDSYIPEQQDSHLDGTVDETSPEEPVASFTSPSNILHETSPSLAEDHFGEPPKHTYASILRSAKVQSGNSGIQTAPLRNPSPVVSELHQAPQSTQQIHAVVSRGPEKSSMEAVEEVTTYDDDGEPKSVYVGNLHPSITEADLEREFKNFGKIRPDGVAIRSRKDTGSYYAFVEFEDLSGVYNALQASPVLLNGREIYVEERRPSSGIYKGGRRGKGRGGYPSEAPRGRLGGRGYGRASGQENDRDYSSKARGNGFYQRGGSRQGTYGNQLSRDGHHQTSEAAT